VPDVEVSVPIDAPAERVWSLVEDPTRIGEFSPEMYKATWWRGSSAGVGARFIGRNRRGWHRWRTFCTVVTYEPPREVAWHVSLVFPIARWGYRIEPASGGGCTLVEWFEDRRWRITKPASVPIRGLYDAATHNRAGMQATLARMKQTAEI
jgi:hypothetical protein